MTQEHQEFIEVINKWGGKIRCWKDSDKVIPNHRFKLIDIPYDVELISREQKFIEDNYDEYI